MEKSLTKRKSTNNYCVQQFKHMRLDVIKGHTLLRYVYTPMLFTVPCGALTHVQLKLELEYYKVPQLRVNNTEYKQTFTGIMSDLKKDFS